MAVHHHIVYLSPNGSTRSVARALANGLSEAESSVGPSDSAHDAGIPGRTETAGGADSAELIDLAEAEASVGFPGSMMRDEGTCLFIGSPVYFNRAVPPIMEFIEQLPYSEGSWAVPFVTYGKACSGIALWQMASALQAKGYQMAGAVKIQAVHSLMWESADPVGDGHPDRGELAQVTEFARTLKRQLQTGTTQALELRQLDYHPTELTAQLRSAMGKPWPVMPKSVDEDACTGCGICSDECPVGTITLTPFPEFGEECIDCFNCVRLCPEEALVPSTPLEEMAEMVRDRVKTVDESPGNKLFSAPLA